MKSWTIGRRVTVTCVVLTVFVMASSLVGMLGALSLRSKIRALSTDALSGVDHLTQMRGVLLEIRGSSYLVAIPGLDEADKQKQLSRIQRMQSMSESAKMEYETSGSISAEELPMFQKSKAKSELFLTAITRFRDLARTNVKNAIEYWDREGIEIWPAARTAINDELDYNRRNAAKYTTQAELNASSINNTNWALLAWSLLASGVLGTYVVRS